MAYSGTPIHPQNPCLRCWPTASTTTWTHRTNGISCGAEKVCQAGMCVGGCYIGGQVHLTGTLNPANACQSCQPATSTTAWTTLANGAACGNNQVCASGACGTSCFIAGMTYASSALNPQNACQSCQPGVSSTTWTTRPSGTSCAAGKVCSGLSCVAGCYIGGVVRSPGALNPANVCESCQTAVSTTVWTARPDGTGCATGKVCSAGTCVASCYIGNQLYNTGAVNPQSPCQTCQPVTSTTTWTAVPGGTVCGTRCVQLQTDPQNCGACGKVCACGGTCAGGQCGPTVLATWMTSGSATPSLAVDATSVYWIDDGGVRKIAKGGGQVTALASIPVPGQNDIALDASSVYWVDRYAGTVSKVPKGGGATTVLASGQNYPIAIAVDATHVYWANQAGATVMKVPLGGGAPTVLVSGDFRRNAYWDIAIDATYAYLIDISSKTVMRVPLGGGAPTVLASEQTYPTAIAVDATHVYWASQAGATVTKVPLGGGATTLIASGQPGASKIATDATHIYWTNNSGGAVMRAPLGGGAPTQFAVSPWGPWGVALDAGCVYWTSFANTLMRAAK